MLGGRTMSWGRSAGMDEVNREVGDLNSRATMSYDVSMRFAGGS